MKLTYYNGTPPNFGDEINATMWAHLLPQNFLDEDENELFLGIGSILWDYLPKAPIKHVMGSGFGGYTGAPDLNDGSWNVAWVRGPVTASLLGLEPDLAICDAAVLLREIPVPAPAKNIDIAFMPHFESTERGNWEAVCRLAGFTYLDPRDDVDLLLARIRGARLLISEAMHGAIVADALRTPWIGIVPFHPQHRAKWEDWAASLSIPLRQAVLSPSSALEAYTYFTGLRGRGRRSKRVLQSRLAAPFSAAFTHAAARQLDRLSRTVDPQLSEDREIMRATERCMETLHRFVSERSRFPSSRSAV
jgi:succinoglycan biosynthesis protein ExoV